MNVGVIGAGLAGLAAAGTLRALGHDVLVFDKGRGPGGRSSTRRAEPFAFDHGAQYFTGRDPGFRRVLDGWLEAGVAARWEGRLVSLAVGAMRAVGGETERFVGTPGMSAAAKHLARDLDLRCGARVERALQVGSGWVLHGQGGVVLGVFERLVVSTPPAQAAVLLAGQSPLAESAAGIDLRPCWAVMLGLARPYEVPFDGAFCEDSILSWIARNNSKPRRRPGEAWVLHSAPAWTEAHLDEAPERVIELLTAELERLTGLVPALVHRAAHHWRFALPAVERDDGCLHDPERGLALAGDAYSGGRIEGAYLSGVAAAHRVVGASPTETA